jgi:hypothetical protein
MLVKIVNTIESVPKLNHVFGKPRQHLADLLKPRSRELENISMSFTARTKDIEIVTFYEEKVMPPFKSEVSRFFRPHRVMSEEYSGIKANEKPITSFRLYHAAILESAFQMKR